MSVLAVVNQKGGVGKTTSTAALGVLLARQGRGVHLIDMDHQADLTSALIVVVKPGGFEMRAVATLEALVNTYREQVNPKLAIAGVILTEMQPRRAINEAVEEEIGQLYPVLGRIRSEAEMMYATSEGRIHKLTRSKALDDYALAAEKLKEVMQWP